MRAKVIDHAGNAWEWNCGWRIVNRAMNPLGHSTFRRSIKIATHNSKGLRFFNMKDRPDAKWRRVVNTQYTHDSIRSYGKGQVLATDGHHAIFLPDGWDEPVKVCFANLSEIKQLGWGTFKTNGQEAGRKPPKSGKRKAKTKSTKSTSASVESLMSKYKSLM